MSNESPLDFYSSSAKRKTTKKKASPSVVQSSESKKSAKSPLETKRKPLPQMEEAKAIVEKIDAMNRDLAEKIEAVSKLVGKTPQELESFIEATSQLSEKDKQLFKKMKKDFADKIKETSEYTEAPAIVTKTSRKEGRPSGDLRTKSIGAKKKWMPIK